MSQPPVTLAIVIIGFFITPKPCIRDSVVNIDDNKATISQGSKHELTLKLYMPTATLIDFYVTAFAIQSA